MKTLNENLLFLLIKVLEKFEIEGNVPEKKKKNFKFMLIDDVAD